MSSLEFDDVEHFTVGTIGEPGKRLFLLQVIAGTTSLTLKVEKAQVATFVTYIAALLSDLERPGHTPEDLELREPIEVAWIAGPIAIEHDAARDRLVVRIAEADMSLTDEAFATGNDVSFAITREQAAAVVIHGTSLVESGRPPCPLCGFPIDPAGHACPRTNGNRPPDL